MKYRVTIDGSAYEVEVERGQAAIAYAGKAESAMQLEKTVKETPEAVKMQQVENTVQKNSMKVGEGTTVCAPMPGTILECRFSNGQAVKSGEVLFVLEAMKMENEIVAPRDGTISSIGIQKNDTVDTGTILCTIV